MRLYQRYLEYRATTFMGGGSTCLSGRTMAYRTQLFRFDGFKNYFLNEHFAGQLQLSGDDKCLTRLCIMSDYKMWHQICEVCICRAFCDDKKVSNITGFGRVCCVWRVLVYIILFHGSVSYIVGGLG